MDTFSVWHWLMVLVFFGGPVLVLVQYLWQRRALAPDAPPSGIAGWLALFAFVLCVSFVRGVAELVQGLPDYLSGFRNEAAHGPLLALGLFALVGMAVQLWAIVALFRKKRSLRTACVILWVLMLLTDGALLSMLTVPGVTPDMILPDTEIIRAIAALAFMAAWCWYLYVSVRVKNTLVD